MQMCGNSPDIPANDAPEESMRIISMPSIKKQLTAKPTRHAMPIADEIDRYTCGLEIAHVNKSATIAPKVDQTIISMPIPFSENSECESAQFKGKREGTHLVPRPDIPAQPSFVLFAAEPTKDVHHGAFAGFFKGAQGDVLGVGQQGFGFSHFSSLMDVSK